jgi:hypothetical protein
MGQAKIRVNIYISSAHHAKLMAIIAKDRRTKSTTLEMMIEKYYDQLFSE